MVIDTGLYRKLDMVRGSCNGVVRDCGLKNHFQIQGRLKMSNERKKIFSITDFGIGLIVGFVIALIIMSLILALVVSNYKNKEVYRNANAEVQTELQVLQEDYFNRDSHEFLDDADVRRTTDEAIGEFERRRDEILRAVRQRTAK